MTLQVIGAGVGRTGTYSLRLALNELGLGPCHHMEEVLKDMPAQVPLWQAALKGKPDWAQIFKGCSSAVDWPTAGFFRELAAAYPDARFVLTVRSPESWVASFSATIYKLIGARDKLPETMGDWLDMGIAVIARTGFPTGLDAAGLERAFLAHNEAVRTVIPADRLLTYEVKQGWGPLCAFLGVPLPDGPFPRSNDRGEFWDLVAGAT